MTRSSRSLRRYQSSPHPRPTSALDPALAPLILELHAAIHLDPLWTAIVHLLDAALPIHDLIAALPYEGPAPMTFRTTVQVDDMAAYRQRIESAEPPLGRIIAESPGLQVAFLDDHVPEAELLASHFYRQVMAPDGVRHLGALLFWTPDQHFIAHIGLNRTAQQGPFTPTERELLLQLHPHLSHAIHRVQLFESQQAITKMLQQALDHPMEGLILINSKEQVVFHNPAAIESCAWWRGGRSEATLKTHHSAPLLLPTDLAQQVNLLLQQFRSQLSHPSQPIKPNESTCHHPSIHGLQATLTLITPADQAVPPHIRIRISRVSKSNKSLPVHLLTQAEFRTAQLAADGLRNDEIASHLGISINTVRAHLRAVFDKLSINHRGELVSHFN
jgi:DNA-binding CsgD family transcriptional regulator